jgi:hypothetical protein
VSFAGRLEEQGAAELLRSLARTSASGKLTLTRRDGHVVMALRAGRIIYCASSSMRETFGNILVLRGLLTEADLLEALERQHQATLPVRLGQVLVAMGKVDEMALREVMRQQTEDVIAEIVRWRTGFFQFEPLPFSAAGETSVDLKDFLLPEGFSAQQMLGDTAPPGPPGPSRARELEATADVALDELHPPSPAVTAEATLGLMRYAAQILGRGVLFVVRPDELRGMGQFGVQVAGHSASDRVRETVVPLGEPSVLRDVVEKRETYRGPLEDLRWNRHLIHRLGGQEPTEVVVIPMIVANSVAVLLYGDNVPDYRLIGPVDTLEFMIAEAGMAMERTLLETREKTLLDRKPL